jgi:hypothetical protein
VPPAHQQAAVGGDAIEIDEGNGDIGPHLCGQRNGGNPQSCAHVRFDGVVDRVIARDPELGSRQRKRLIARMEIGSDSPQSAFFLDQIGLHSKQLTAQGRERRKHLIHPLLGFLDLAPK